MNLSRKALCATVAAACCLYAALALLGLCNGSVLARTGSMPSLWSYLVQEQSSLILLTLPVLLPGRWGFGYALILLGVLTPITAVNLAHAELYGAPLASYVVDLLRETTTSELREFFSAFLGHGPDPAAGAAGAEGTGPRFDLLLWMALPFVLTLPWLVLLRKIPQRSRAGILVLVLLGGIMVVRPLGWEGLLTVLRWNYGIDFVVSCVDNVREHGKLAASLAGEPDLPPGIRRRSQTAPGGEGRLLVLVIGESASRNHFSLYGYGRPTTPRLDSLRGELLVYDDVIAPHANTVASLQKGLTFANLEGDAALCSVVDVLRAASFTVRVLSNQPRLGLYDTSASLLLGRADEVRYFNTSNTSGYYQVASHDGVLLEPFAELLQKQRPHDEVIILHLMGSHIKYALRTPPDFPVFSDDPPYGDRLDPARRSEQTALIDAYDRSIAYTDSVLGEVLELLRADPRPSSLLYVADHSDMVFEDGKTVGHAGNGIAPLMYEIPFVLWLSPAFKRLDPDFARRAADAEHRPWQTDELIYALLDLGGVEFDGMKREKSLFSNEFRPTQRQVGGEGRTRPYVPWSWQPNTTE